jgi:predicted nucleic acid-binding Zn ribbon protein
MAKYEFKCNTCNIQYEVDRVIGDTVPPLCCQVPMARVYSAPAIKFKGTGWASKE